MNHQEAWACPQLLKKQKYEMNHPEVWACPQLLLKKNTK